MKKLGIIGAGRFGRLASNLARDTAEFSVIMLFDDVVEIGTEGVVGKIGDIEKYARDGQLTHLSIAVGYKHFHFREELFERFRNVLPIATLVHPTAFVSAEAKLGEGVSIYSMVNVEMGAVVDHNATIFNQSSITHDAHIGRHSFLSVAVGMGGGVDFGARTFVGVNATLVNDISVGDDSIICGGTFLTKSIPENSCVIGNPYRQIDRVFL
ncbi:MAG: hypothetical protein OSB41_03390 [Kiritimatiellae bacterium]|nr:hypothetical protein [Kiritimatiellia bacterium]